MAITLPAVLAQMLSAPMLRPTGAGSAAPVSVDGVVEQLVDQSTIVVKVPSGSVTLSVPPNQLRAGDPVSLIISGNQVVIRLQSDTAQSPPNPPQLPDQYGFKPTLSASDLVTVFSALAQTGSAAPVSADVQKLLVWVQDALTARGATILLPRELAFVQEQVKRLIELMTQSGEGGATVSSGGVTLKIQNLLRDLADQLKTGMRTSAVSFTIDTDAEEGFYSFPDLNTARTALGQIKDGAVPAQTAPQTHSTLQQDARPVFVKVERSARDSLTRAIVMDRLMIEAELVSTNIAGLKHPIWKTMSPSVFGAALVERGSLKTSELAKLDSALIEADAQQQPVVTQSVRARADAEPVITRWLQQAIDQPGNQKYFAQRYPSQPVTVVNSTITRLDQFVEYVQKEIFSGSDLRTNAVSGASLVVDSEHIPGRVAQSPAVSPPLVSPQESVAIREFVTEASTLLRNVSERLSQLEPQLTANPAKPLDAVLRSLFDTLGFSLERRIADSVLSNGKIPLSQDVVDSCKGALLKILSRLDTLPEPLRKVAAEFFADDNTATPGQSTPTLRAFLETAVNRLEAFQLIARPLQLGESNQQLFVFPMYVEGQWTQASIQLSRRHAGNKKKKGKDSYTVQLTVAPSQVGPVSASIAYQPKHSTNISIECDRPETRVYFEKNRKTIADALVRIGLPSVRLSVDDPATEPVVSARRGSIDTLDITG